MGDAVIDAVVHEEDEEQEYIIRSRFPQLSLDHSCTTCNVLAIGMVILYYRTCF